MLKTNFHTHTQRCKHACDSDEAYVQAAIQGGFSVLGFADHTPWPQDRAMNRIRMDLDELDGYIASVRSLAEKYADRIDVRCGLECEYYPEHLSWLEKTREEKHLDYLILGSHFDLSDRGRYFGNPKSAEDILLYAERTACGIRTGMFAYCAHPDLPMRRWNAFDETAQRMADMICTAALETGTPLEFNLAGLEYTSLRDIYGVTGMGYPCDGFWQYAAKRGCTAIIGCDSHSAEHLRSCGQLRFDVSAEYLEKLGIRRVDMIPMRGK